MTYIKQHSCYLLTVGSKDGIRINSDLKTYHFDACKCKPTRKQIIRGWLEQTFSAFKLDENHNEHNSMDNFHLYWQ